jgi:hypothetical protein
MFLQLVLALALASVTVILHAVGTVKIVLPLTCVRKSPSQSPEFTHPVWTLTRLVSLLLVLHLTEMTIWAAGFATFGLFSDFETSIYYSMKSYTTVGYGDILPEPKFRLLGPIEAAVGILMLGWSTSVIVAAVQRIYNPRSDSSTKS